MNYAWVLALLLAPVLFAPAAFQLGIVLAALAIVPIYLAFLFYRHPTARSLFNLPVLLLIVAVLLSLYASVDLRVSLPPLCGIFLALVILSTLVAHSQLVSPTKILLLTWLIGLALALVTLATPEPLDKFAVPPFITPRLPDAFAAAILALREGRALNSNVAAGMLLLILPLNFVALRFLPRAMQFRSVKISFGVMRVTLLVSFALIVFAFVLAQSRSAFVGLSSALLFLLWMRFPTRRPLLMLASSTLLLFAALALLQIRAPLPASLLFDSDLTGNLPGREEIWTRSVALFQDFPLTGVGLGAFSSIANALYPFFIHSPLAPPPHAHNLLLQVAVELGALGLIGYVGLLVAFVWCIRFVYHRAVNPLERWTILALAAGMLAYQVYGLTDATGVGTRAGLLFWIALGAAGSMYARVKEPSRAMEWLPQLDMRLPFGLSRNVLLASSFVLCAAIIFTFTLRGAWSCGLESNAFAIETARAVILIGPETIRLPLFSFRANSDDANDPACAARIHRLAGIELLMAQQNEQAAIEKFEMALTASPNDFAAQLWLARAREQIGDMERALMLWMRVGNFRHLRELARASENDGNLDRAIYIWHGLGYTVHLEELARKSEREGDYDRAIQIWQRLGNTQRLKEIANASEQKGEFTRALALWQKLENVERVRALAARALNANDLVHAAAALDVLEKLAPEDQRLDKLELQLAEKYATNGEHANAISYFQRALARNPRNLRVQLGLLHALWQNGNAREAFAQLVSGLCAVPTKQELWDELNGLLRDSDHEKLLLLRAELRAPTCAPKTHTRLLNTLAAEANRRADFEIAILVLEELRDAPALRQILAHIGTTDTHTLKLTYAALTRAAPADGSNYVRLARLFIAEGGAEEARALLERAAAQRVDSPWLYLLLGDLYRANKENAQELETYRHALTFLNEPQPLYLALGTALLQAGQTDEAAEYLQRAVKFKPKDAGAHFYLARALWDQKQWAAALDELAVTLCLRPDNKRYRALWQASVQEAIKLGVTNYAVEFDFARC